MEILSVVITVAPLLLLVAYVLLNQFSKKTKTKIDDYLKEIVGELLEGLGKSPPKPLDPKLTDKEDKN